MDKLVLHQELLKFMSSERVLLDEPMKKHTSFKIGGPADLLLIPNTIEEIQKIIDLCREKNAPFFVMGNGSNLLVRDKGLRLVVIKIAENFNRVCIEGSKITAQAGVLLSSLSKAALKESLSGLEFASGIPGTLGGAITMNAGAYGGEMKDVVTACKVIDREGQIRELSIEAIEMGYRTSIIQKLQYIVLEVEMKLEKEDYMVIKDKVDELNLQRTTKQPLHLPSAGSVFKRPEGFFAGKLIQDSNLKGYKVGGAQVSELHSGFIVNVDNATAEDVISLIKHIQQEVKRRFDVELHTEVKIIGEE
ncbi:UDP-N-acetylmuramate dehydrogenase [Alkaliphilus peptidifermentans]|uniref:UDP-N-acetylenolpyruvoylglucosamine reductase n=1 Tax=Alkaliphilus peptidifermentans DSM 18978 TaxID=1120976 RepID=A0A1G5KWZ6_9FIRM|nr:UDP-N-acetylmuramate dehydrogenase [Alkaliphilus peptidifermentans]SCZ05203.1 UDP-N-acetylmuramate dehydrogenase [Alkaliphilus peptidifermentans DSM 18978]